LAARPFWELYGTFNLEITDKGTLLQEFLKTLDYTPRKTIYFLIHINQKIYEFLNYNIRMDPGVQSCEETLDSKSGSCRDYAWLFVQTLRHLGFGARFVSGYLVQLKSDEKSLDGPSGPEEDFTDLHAWAEVYLPGAGWIGFDATSGLLAGEGHIPLACTPTFESAAPVSGMSDVCETEFEFENSVRRIFESPRVTKPYTEEQWKAIYKLGFKVEKQLEKGDVRLTMGGEPTFVSIDDMESPEWNTEADGPHKRALAKNLSAKLYDEFAKGGVLHQAQGKWYPGEPLPRWSIELCWRKDGRNIWNNKKLLSLFSDNPIVPENADILFLEMLSKHLGITDKTIIPTYEDAFYFMWEEGKLPVDIDPTKDDGALLVKNKLKEILKDGKSKPVGYVLPLNNSMGTWYTSHWTFRRDHLFLIPGNSPIGLRLPLDSLIRKPEQQEFPQFHPDNFSVKGRLPSFKKTAATRYENVIKHGTNDPPKDYRLESMKVTPDPGVIEINVHPAKNWEELTHNTLTLYELAKQSRLGTEKFMLDGKHTGTGGGNHVTKNR